MIGFRRFQKVPLHVPALTETFLPVYLVMNIRQPVYGSFI